MNLQSISKVPSATATTTTHVTLEAVLRDIESSKYREQVEEVRTAYRRGGKEAARPLKKRLLGILFSGRFSQRKDEAIEQHSGILAAESTSANPTCKSSCASIQRSCNHPPQLGLFLLDIPES